MMINNNFEGESISKNNNQEEKDLSLEEVNKKVEKFYKKPRNQEELKKNLKILREIPEDKKESKVIIKLGDPEKSHKFVLMKDEDQREYLIALPIDRKSMHKDIVALSRKLYNKDFQVKGGGYIHTEGDKLIADGRSGDYGVAPQDRVKEILNNKFPDIEVEVNLEKSESEDKEDELKEMLEDLETVVQKELYSQVVEDKAIKLGFDYTSIPEKIDDRNDFAYMIYSSENGSNFGFDTLYIGFKDEEGDVETKAILRERGYIQVVGAKIDSETNTLRIACMVSGEEKNISIPLDKIKQIEMSSNLNEKEKSILEIYKNTQFAIKGRIFHGIN